MCLDLWLVLLATLQPTGAASPEARKMSGKLDEHYDKWSKIAADIEDDEPSPDPGTRPLPPAQTAPHAVASLCATGECARSRL